jgi:hypothetical protein
MNDKETVQYAHTYCETRTEPSPTQQAKDAHRMTIYKTACRRLFSLKTCSPEFFIALGQLKAVFEEPQ